MTALPIAGRATVRRAVAALISRHRRAVITLLCLNAAAATAGLVAPWLLGVIIDRVDAGTAAASTVDVLAALVCVSVVTQIVLTRFARRSGFRFGETALADLRERFIDRTLALPIATVERAGTGDLMTRAGVDVTTVGLTLREALPELSIAAVQVVFILAAVFVLDPLFGLLALTGVPSVVLALRWYLRRARAAYLAEGQAMTEVSENLAATAEGARTVEALRMAAARVAEGDDRIRTSFRTRVRTLRLRTVLFPILDASQPLSVAVTLFVGGLLFHAEAVSLGAVIAAALYQWQLVDPLERILDQAEAAQRGAASFARIEGVAEVAPAPRPAGTVPVGDRLDIRGLRYAYQPGHDVLHGVDLAVEPGERLAIVGASGAGKSTLGRLVAGLDAPGSGSITIGGAPVGDLDPAELRRRVALVSQEHHVFMGTLRDNLALAGPDAADAEMEAALTAVGAGWAHGMGLDTVLGAGGVELDAPKAQQVALARLVLADPHTLVLDEATSMLDPTAARDTERSLAAVLAGRTVIAIAHRLQTAHDADRVAVMDAGRVVELGTHEELVAAGGAYASLWRSWHG